MSDTAVIMSNKIGADSEDCVNGSLSNCPLKSHQSPAFCLVLSFFFSFFFFLPSHFSDVDGLRKGGGGFLCTLKAGRLTALGKGLGK